MTPHAGGLAARLRPERIVSVAPTSVTRSDSACPGSDRSPKSDPIAPAAERGLPRRARRISGMDVSQRRRDYGRGELREEDLLPDPIAQFRRWFDEAVSANIVDPNAMSLATATPSGETTIRTVLLKGYSDEGFVFFTNLESTKAKQIAHNRALVAAVSLARAQAAGHRQRRGRGEFLVVEVARYFLSRPRESRIAAWVSHQSQVVSARHILEAKFDELVRKFGKGEIPLPSFWGGFRVAPKTIEFWQGGRNRLHDRFLYSRADAGWRIARLAP